MTTDLYATEHAHGLHELYAPPGCPECPKAPPKLTPELPSPPPAAPELRSDSGFVSLGEAIERIAQARGGHLFGDGLPPALELPEPPDGDPYCEACHGFRWVRQDSPARIPLPAIRCTVCLNAPWAVQRRIDKLLGHLPSGLRDFRLHTYPTRNTDQLRIVHRLISWLEAPNDPWLYLHGPVGRGKTGLAVGLLYELTSRGWSGSFKIATDLLSAIKATYGTREGADDPGELDILHALYTVDIFVLDDLGSEHHRTPDDWATEKLFQVIDGRYVERKRMIITSNLRLRELSDRLGHPRTASRIHERTNPEWIVDLSGLPNLRWDDWQK